MNLKDFKKEFDPHLIKFINQKIKEVSKDKDIYFLKDYFEYLNEFIKDGKRFRPYTANLAYSNFGGKANKEILKLLVFLEIFHYFCVIHDDIMDNSLQRHGLKTLNKMFGNSQALLIGDYLFAWSWEIILNSNLDYKLSLKLSKLFSEMIHEVFMGQALDLQTSEKQNVTNKLIMKKTLLKTSGYTFSKPMQIGLLLSGNYNEENMKFSENLGKNLGLAFQIQDDLLDITSDFDGKKTPLSDVIEGKHTIFTNFVFVNGTTEQKSKLKKYFGNEIDDIEFVRKIFYESGAIDYGKDLINKYFIKAKNLTNKNKELLDFIKLIEDRKS